MGTTCTLVITASIRCADGTTTVIGSAEREMPLVYDLGSIPAIKTAIDAVEATVEGPCNEIKAAAMQTVLNEVSNNSITEKPKNPYRKGCQSVHVELMPGRFHINVPNSTVANEHIGSQTVIFSTALTRCVLYGATTQAYRPLANNLNMCTERKVGDMLKYRTLATLVNCIGTDIQYDMTKHAYAVLMDNGFSVDMPPEPEKPGKKNTVEKEKENEKEKEKEKEKTEYEYKYAGAPEKVGENLTYNAPSLTPEEHKNLIQLIESYNVRAGRNVVKRLQKMYPEWKTTNKKEYFSALNPELNKFLIHEEDIIGLLEMPAEKKTYIYIDGILSVRQKHHHGKNYKRNGKFLENHVAVIEADGITKSITAPDLKLLFNIVLAYLIENNLLDGRRLIFFADGADEIRIGIEETFSFRNDYLLFLDWYHCSTKIYQKLSMALKGTKAEKRTIRGYLKALLWIGHPDDAIKYLKSLSGSDIIKNEQALSELITYLQRKSPYIPCYEIRREYKYHNSSNRVEQQNYVLIARRQKNNAMSWSEIGSAALAAVTMLIRNHDLEEYLETGHVPFRFWPTESDDKVVEEAA